MKGVVRGFPMRGVVRGFPMRGVDRGLSCYQEWFRFFDTCSTFRDSFNQIVDVMWWSKQ